MIGPQMNVAPLDLIRVMGRIRCYNHVAPNGAVIASVILLVSVLSLAAEPKTFQNEGLKTVTIVTLDVQKSKVSGTFASAEYGEKPEAQHHFAGKIIPTPKGKKGVFMRIQFEGAVPYSAPPDVKTIDWFLKIVDHRAHLFIPMQERSYEGKTPKWIVSDVEFVPSD